MNATKRAQVPFGLRKKLMAATSMLLVAAIMLVSTSYAWFTLSTAPEITGITTSVGANGNLEIALLTTETFDDTGLITSNTGDSMEAQDKTKANITWGNLVDLDDPSYGLNLIKMYPSALNAANGAVSASPLSIPEYGADGRVSKMNAISTAAAIYDGAAFTVGGETYGVRAVGTSSTMSPRQMAFTAAKENVKNNDRAAQSAVSGPVSANMEKLLGLAATGTTSYSEVEVTAMRDMIAGVDSSLKKIVAAYANAIIAIAAAEITDEAQVSLLNNTLSGITSATDLIALIPDDISTNYTADLTTLETAQTNVAKALANANKVLTVTGPYGETVSVTEGDTTTTINITSDIVAPLVGGTSEIKVYDAGGKAVTVSKENISALMQAKEAYLSGGAVNTVAEFTGNFNVAYYGNLVIKAGVKNSAVDKLDAVQTTLGGLNPDFGTSAAANISDFYGYIIDLAFRTNAADSNLLLATEGRNRVYSNATDANLATMGSGSNATFTYGDDNLTKDQAENLLNSFRVVFFNTDTKAILATAKFGNVEEGATTGDLVAKLMMTSINTATGKYTLGQDAYTVPADPENGTYTLTDTTTYTENNCTNYDDKIDKATYDGLAATTVKAADTTSEDFNGSDRITSLNQNEVHKISVMVYLDGNNIDNADVNAVGTSGTLKLNLQFYSDGDLVPMENNALKTMDKNTGTNP